jgi:hypothetical protein
MLEVAMLPAVIVAHWPRGFIMLEYFSLLVKLAEVKDLGFTEFGKVFVEFCDCIQPFPNQMNVQGSNPQSFDGLGNDMVIGYFRSLGFQLQKPSIEIRQGFFLVLSAREEIFLCAELHLEPL